MANKRPIAAEDLYEFQLISDNELSPDGKWIAYSVSRVDKESQKKYSNLWLVATDGRTPARQITFGDQSDGMPRWSPDSTELAFVSNRGDKERRKSQVYLLPLTGGEARPLSNLEGTVREMAWSPDGKHLALAFRKRDAEVMEREKDPAKKELGVVVRHVTRPIFKFDGAGMVPKERTHIWRLDVADGEAVQLTDHDVFDENEPLWSLDSGRIYFTSNRLDQPDMHPYVNEIYYVPAAGGEIVRVPSIGPAKGMLRLSPDGKWLSFTASAVEQGHGWRNNDLWVMPMNGSAAPVNLTRESDLHVAGVTLNDLGGDSTSVPDFTSDSKTLVFEASRHGKTIVYRIDVAGGTPTPVIDENGVVVQWQLHQDNGTLAYLAGNLYDPGQLFVRPLDGGKAKQLTRQNKALLDSIDFGNVEETWVKSPDDYKTHGWIVQPPNFDPGKAYPCILEIHGGPFAQYGFFLMHEFYYLAAQGYVVCFTNPRGGQGYGEAHGKAIWGKMAEPAHEDLMAWADYLAELPYVDAERMGVTGGSYGGYMTLWIIGHDHRFKAAVAQRVVSNWVSMWGNSDFNWHFQSWVGDKPPWENIEQMWQWSPMAHMGNVKTPTLIVHSEADLRCNIEQGEQAFVALQYMGVESEMVRFPDEPHGLSRSGRADRRIARLTHIRRWMDKYLQPEKGAAD